MIHLIIAAALRRNTWRARIVRYRQLAIFALAAYAVKRDSGTDDTTGHDAPALRSTGRIGRCAAPRYHLVAVTPLDLGAILTADRP